MKKTTLSRDLKFGLIVIGALFLVYFGLNFLKGINIFSSTYTYYTRYDEVGGLVASTPVYLKGYKVGQVDEIRYDFSQATPFTVRLSVSKDVRLPHGTLIDLYEDGLMGGKALRLLMPADNVADGYYGDNDFVAPHVSAGLMSTLAGSLLPKLESLSTEADSLLRSLRRVAADENIARTLASAERAAADLAVTSGSLRRLMGSDIPQLLSRTDTLLADATVISGNLREVDFRSTLSELDHTVANLSTMTDRINGGEGTLGALLNDRELYLNLLRATSSADSLLTDLKRSPRRYVHFSLFGGRKD